MRVDMTSDLGCSVGMPPVAATTDNTAFVSTILDTKDKHAVSALLLTGTLGDADATFTTLLEESAASNMAGANTVAAAETVLTQASAGFTFASDNVPRKIGYLGSKRYIRLTVTPANNTGNVFLAMAWLWNQGTSPVAQITT